MAAFRPLEHRRERRVLDRLGAVIEQQVLLADIGNVGGLRILGEQVVKGLVPARPQRLRDRFVPFLRIRELRVDVENDAAEIKDAVADHVADGEARDDQHYGAGRAA